MRSEFVYTSEDPKIGEPPSFSWEHFATPKLRRLPQSSFTFVEYVGHGAEGIVVKVKADGYPEPIVFKIFLQREQRENHGINRYHFPFQRECINGALLELITTSFKRAKAEGKPISLNLKPKTRSKAFQNLETFSVNDDGSSRVPDEEMKGLQLFETSDADDAAIMAINSCLGWTELDTSDVVRDLKRLQCSKLPELPEPKVFCIAYRFVPEGELDMRTVVAQANFFHVAGFYQRQFKGNNWRGRGVLVDFSDLVPLHETLWSPQGYSCFEGWVQDAKESHERWINGTLEYA